MNRLDQEIREFKMQLDSKMVKLRQEFDIGQLKRMIGKKAEENEFKRTSNDHETKIKLLDDNTLQLANDLETFQKVLAKMHTSITELQEVNKDVLLGKKNPNCLSCNNGKDKFEKMSHVQGNDGKLYFGKDPTKAQSQEMGKDTTKVIVDFKNPHSPSAIMTPTYNGKNHKGYTSYIESLMEGGRDSKNVMDLSDHTSKLRYNNRANNNMDNSFLDSFGLRHLKPKKGRIETVIYHSSSNRNSMSHSKLKINQKKKLPIGFMVQNEVKSGQYTEMD